MSDERIRERALDPAESFIVQAPAGSGKTELLIRRYLTLLAHVDEPEQIIAITFTRKAAAEMRQRVAQALDEASAPGSPAQPHREATLALARRVLARSGARGWALPEQSDRLRIETLDALNARLARQLPVLSGGVAGASVVDDASELYRIAARRTVDALGDASIAPPLRRLIARFEHSAARVESLVAQLLPKREQWLRYFAFDDESALRGALESALERLVREELERTAQRFPHGARAELAALLAHAAPSIGLAAADDTPAALEVRDSDPPVMLLERANRWRAAAELLLTKQDEWRRRADRRLGFGPEHADERRRLVELIESLADDDALRDALARVRRLPEPRYSDEQWRAIADLRVVLRHAAAELRVAFAEGEVVDFVEIALAARQALGAEDAPSDLLLALDHRIRHILVDEFQDTSHGQLRLLEILTAGWMPGDGRTLFLVGDPMQSIYRFRDADMSLFLKVRREGIGQIRCVPLTLERNFRSAPAIIGWVNETLSTAFPAADDIGRGEVRFTPCRAARDLDGRVDVHVLRGGDEVEVDAALDLIERERAADPEGTFAVLVQSRAHLGGLHRRLRERGLAVNAVEIEPLREQQIVQDVLGLARALLHPADSIAWLGLLRAPWCGLRWTDLAEIAALSSGRTIREAIGDPDALERLSADGRARVERFAARLERVLDARADYGLAEWIERAWHALGGPACAESDDDLRSAEQVFATLGQLARRGDVDDPTALEAAFTAPRAMAAEASPGAIEIMTIHRAKGLEFDTVVLLGLGRETRREEQRALYWMERVAADGREDWLLAPLPAPGGEDRVTALIREADEQRDAAERTRLLYVAATRAKRRLHLVCRLDDDAEAPPARSLLAPIWPALAAEIEPERPARNRERREIIQPVLRRLVEIDDDARVVGPLGAALAGDGEQSADDTLRPEFEWAGQPARQIGTVVHRRLQRIAIDGLDAWSAERVAAARGDIRRELELLGLSADEAENAADAVVDALAHVLDDATGRWILSARDDARSELTLAIRASGRLEHVRLDRTFVDADGTRWIVDFKTGTHEGSDVDAFLDAEVERYRAQLERYAAAFDELEPGRPIKAALYFPLLRAFRSWTPRSQAAELKASP